MTALVILLSVHLRGARQKGAIVIAWAGDARHRFGHTRGIKIQRARAVIRIRSAMRDAAQVRGTHRVKIQPGRGLVMADQDWLAAGGYLVGLVSVMLLISAVSMRATRMRKATSRTRN
ncbi:MAG TPA: hypothetical protein VHU21_07970 [Paraburkholderia sp.]|nr:hypothetical protein [Paraburkholderia sp.]